MARAYNLIIFLKHSDECLEKGAEARYRFLSQIIWKMTRIGSNYLMWSIWKKGMYTLLKEMSSQWWTWISCSYDVYASGSRLPVHLLRQISLNLWIFFFPGESFLYCPCTGFHHFFSLFLMNLFTYKNGSLLKLSRRKQQVARVYQGQEAYSQGVSAARTIGSSYPCGWAFFEQKQPIRQFSIVHFQICWKSTDSCQWYH